MIKNISVIGLGKLGGAMAACFASRGFNVFGADINSTIVQAFNKGRSPYQEAGLDNMIKTYRSRISATSKTENAIVNSEITFVVVPTPSEQNGAFSLKYIQNAFKKIGQAIRKTSRYHNVVLTSTVLPGSCRYSLIPVLEKESGKKCGIDFGMCYNPEFIALGTVIKDFLNPDFYLLGQFDKKSGDALEFVHKRVSLNQAPVKRMNLENAELAKIALNSFVTLKISFANMLAQFCEKIPNGDVDVVTDAIGMDKRIGKKYLTGGLGFSGPCFPRDNIALDFYARQLHLDSRLVKTNHEYNQVLLNSIVKKILKILKPNSKISVLGLAYKNLSDVIDESPGVHLCRILAKRGFQVTAHDSFAIPNAQKVLKKTIKLTKNLSEALLKPDAIIITTKDLAYLKLKPEKIYKNKKITFFDPWRAFRYLQKVPNINYVPTGIFREFENSEKENEK